LLGEKGISQLGEKEGRKEEALTGRSSEETGFNSRFGRKGRRQGEKLLRKRKGRVSRIRGRKKKDFRKQRRKPRRGAPEGGGECMFAEGGLLLCKRRTMKGQSFWRVKRGMSTHVDREETCRSESKGGKQVTRKPQRC